MIRMNCDYLEGCHHAILEALTATNFEQTPGYGLDPHCMHAADLVRTFFSVPDADVHFLVGGTQTNATVIAAALRPWQGALSADTGHINVHETGAIEATGHKVLALPGKDGRITAAQVDEACTLQGNDEHTVKPGMVYISFPTEVGTLYSLAELQELYEICQKWGLYLFIDGARLGYGLTSPMNDVTPADLARYSDVLTLGGTKVGALFGEAVLITNPALKPDFRYIIKQKGGMLAKGRLLGIQFETLLTENRYLTIAQKAIDQAMRIREALQAQGVPFLVDSPTNQLFPIFTDAQHAALSHQFEFALWSRLDDARAAYRICTSWATRDEAVEQLVRMIQAL